MCYYLAHTSVIDVICFVVFLLIMPVSILIINVVVAIQVRRAAVNAASNLGVHPHHQSTSAVPTIMLITTSLIYVLLNTIRGILFVIRLWVVRSNFMMMMSTTNIFIHKCFYIASIVYRFVFAYNFYVYFITGKQFRSDLHKLICRCSSSSSSAHAHAHALAPVVIAAAGSDQAEVARRVRSDTAV